MDKENTQPTLVQAEEQTKLSAENRNGSSNPEKNNKILQSKRRHVSFKQDTSKSVNNGKSIEKLLLIPKQLINNQKMSNIRKPPLSATLAKRSTEIEGFVKLNTAHAKVRAKQELGITRRESATRSAGGAGSEDEGSAMNSAKSKQQEKEVINPFMASVEETPQVNQTSPSFMEFTLSKFAPAGPENQAESPKIPEKESPKFEKPSPVLSSTELRTSQESKLSAFYGAGGIKSPKARFLVNALQAKKTQSEDVQSPHEVHKLLQENNQLKKENDRKEELIGFLLTALKQKEVNTPATPIETPTVTLPEIENFMSPKESNRYFNFNLHEKPMSAGLGKSNLLVPPKEILTAPRIESFERNKSQQFTATFGQPPDFPAFRPTKPVLAHHRRMKSPPALPVFQKAKSIYSFNEMLTIQRGNSSPAYSPNYMETNTNAPLLTMPDDGDLNFRDVFLSREISTKSLRNNMNNPSFSSIQHNLANSRRNLTNINQFDLYKDIAIRKSLNDERVERVSETKDTNNPMRSSTTTMDLNATFGAQNNEANKVAQPETLDSQRKPKPALVRKGLKSSGKLKLQPRTDCNKENANAIKIFETYSSSKEDNKKEKFPKDIFNINVKKKFFG